MADQWSRWHIDVHAEVHAGKQSRVFDATLDGRRAAVKLTAATLTDVDVLTSRMLAVETLASFHPNVVAPTRIDGALVQPIGDWLVSATPFIDGEPLDHNIGDTERLGSALAELHLAMRRLDRFEIPRIATLISSAIDEDPDAQLLHGDFNTKNVITTSDGIRIFDFDDCGYGPIEYDVANSLYMVLFDADVTSQPERYNAFRPAFLDGYEARSNRQVSGDAIDDMIAVRIDALGRWLAEPSTAPIGIRTSSPEWREVLKKFVKARRPQHGT